MDWEQTMRRRRGSVLSKPIPSFFISFIVSLFLIYFILYLRTPKLSQRLEKNWETLKYFGVEEEIFQLEEDIARLQEEHLKLSEINSKFTQEISIIQKKIKAHQEMEMFELRGIDSEDNQLKFMEKLKQEQKKDLNKRNKALGLPFMSTPVPSPSSIPTNVDDNSSKEQVKKTNHNPCSLYETTFSTCYADFVYFNQTYHNILKKNEGLISSSLLKEIDQILNEKSNDNLLRPFGDFDFIEQ